MSLHALADHMAARGRGPDTTLVHMAPQEVAGLQALALAHGGSLTINPDTGLPEAGFLKKLLPALAGFALNAFAPGFGTAIGGMLGVGGAAGTAIGLGGITGLATGNLQKGLMAGLGAYGGASLAGGVMGAGVGAAAQEGANLASSLTDAQAQSLGFQNAATAPAANAAAASNFDKLGAGFNAITKDPSAFGSFAKQNAGSLLAATSPLLADQGVQTVTKLDNPGYIRNFDYDPMTQTARALNPVRVRDLGYADGGSIGAPKTVTQMPGTSPYRDSQAAYEYLMGIAPKEPQQNTQTQTPTSINPASEGRYAWDSDKKAYTFIPANGVTETTPTPAPALNYEFGGGDSGSGVGGGSGGVGTAGAGVSASDSADFGDTSSSSSNSDSSSDSGDGGVSGGGGGGAADSGGTGDGDGGANGGLMRLHKKFAEGGPTNIRDGSSQAAYNYLMGLTNSTRPDAPAYTPQPVYTPQPTTPTTSVAPTTPTTPIIPTTPTTRGITTLPTTTPTEPTGGITTLPTAPVTPVAPVTPTTPTATTITDDFVPSIRTKPIISSITDDVYRETTPRIIPERELELPEIPAVPDRTGIVDMQPATPGVLPAEEVGPRRGGGGDLPEEFDQYIKPETVATPDGGATVTMPAETAAAQPDGGATVNMPEVVEKVVNAPVVQDTPDGGATVTLPESPYVPADVADTFDPDTGSYVEVGNAGGDFGDSGFEQSDDFGNLGNFGGMGGGGGGGKYLDDLSNSVFDAANGGMTPYSYAMGGGLGSLGGYSDGGRLLRGPGDGVSDSIPAMIGKKQPARLADGEFVVPARIVSELGNGSTEAGARKLYKMMDRIQAARGKTVGKGRVAKNSRAEKYLPA